MTTKTTKCHASDPCLPCLRWLSPMSRDHLGDQNTRSCLFVVDPLIWPWLHQFCVRIGFVWELISLSVKATWMSSHLILETLRPDITLIARPDGMGKAKWREKTALTSQSSTTLIIIITHGCTPYLILNAVSDLYEKRSNMCWPHFIDCWWNIYENENWLLALCLHNRH